MPSPRRGWLNSSAKTTSGLNLTPEKAFLLALSTAYCLFLQPQCYPFCSHRRQRNAKKFSPCLCRLTPFSPPSFFNTTFDKKNEHFCLSPPPPLVTMLARGVEGCQPRANIVKRGEGGVFILFMSNVVLKNEGGEKGVGLQGTTSGKFSVHEHAWGAKGVAKTITKRRFEGQMKENRPFADTMSIYLKVLQMFQREHLPSKGSGVRQGCSQTHPLLRMACIPKTESRH